MKIKVEDVARHALLSKVASGITVAEYSPKETVFRQGDVSDALFYIESGKIKLTVLSSRGKEAVVAILGAGDFLGEGCLAGEIKRVGTAAPLGDCVVMRLKKSSAVRALREDAAFSATFLAYLLVRNIRIQEDLVDQLFNSSEKRLARVLLLLAKYGKSDQSDVVIPKITQETLAEMIGTTRSRVSYFMNKFRKLGFIKYNGTLEVHRSLLNIVLRD